MCGDDSSSSAEAKCVRELEDQESLHEIQCRPNERNARHRKDAENIFPDHANTRTSILPPTTIDLTSPPSNGKTKPVGSLTQTCESICRIVLRSINCVGRPGRAGWSLFRSNESRLGISVGSLVVDKFCDMRFEECARIDGFGSV